MQAAVFSVFPGRNANDPNSFTFSGHTFFGKTFLFEAASQADDNRSVSAVATSRQRTRI